MREGRATLDPRTVLLRPGGPRTAAVAEAWAGEERHVARFDPLLDLIGLRLRQPAGRRGCVDAVFERLLQRRTQVVRLNAELLRRVVDDRLVLLLRRREMRRGERSA